MAREYRDDDGGSLPRTALKSMNRVEFQIGSPLPGQDGSLQRPGRPWSIRLGALEDDSPNHGSTASMSDQRSDWIPDIVRTFQFEWPSFGVQHPLHTATNGVKEMDGATGISLSQLVSDGMACNCSSTRRVWYTPIRFEAVPGHCTTDSTLDQILQ